MAALDDLISLCEKPPKLSRKQLEARIGLLAKGRRLSQRRPCHLTWRAFLVARTPIAPRTAFDFVIQPQGRGGARHYSSGQIACYRRRGDRMNPKRPPVRR
jgi:hypothetical protein